MNRFKKCAAAFGAAVLLARVSAQSGRRLVALAVVLASYGVPIAVSAANGVGHLLRP